MRSMKKYGRKFLLAALIAGATVSGVSMALPMPPDGSILVVESYADAALTQQVGAKVYGTCYNSPYPISWGVQTSYRHMYFYKCGNIDDLPPIE